MTINLSKLYSIFSFNIQNINLIVFICLLVISKASILQAEFQSQIADGLNYYCKSNYSTPASSASNAPLFGNIYDVKKNTQLNYTRTRNKVTKLISKYSSELKRGNLTVKKIKTYKAILKNLRTVRSDLEYCVVYGSTNKLNDGGLSTAKMCSIITEPKTPFVVSKLSTNKIIQGQTCSTSNSPVVFLLIYLPNNEFSACTGTVVRGPNETNSYSVIFAAHCVEGATKVSILSGKTEIPAVSFNSYTNWDSNSKTVENGDVAIALFNTPLPFNYAHIYTGGSFTENELGMIAGYGRTEFGANQKEELKFGPVKLGNITPSSLQIYFLGLGSNTCNGDSGGPLFFQRNSEWQVVGTTSNGTNEDCNYGDLSSFSNLSDPNVLAWLQIVSPNLF